MLEPESSSGASPATSGTSVDRYVNSGGVPSSPLSEEEQRRSCRFCLVEKPIGQFRPQKRLEGKVIHRARHCNQCHAQKEAARLRGKRLQADRRQLYQAWGFLARPETKRMNVERFLFDLMRRFGGSGGLAEAWHEAFMEAAAARRLRACESLTRLVDWFTKYPAAVTGAAALEDAQLERELQQARIEETAKLIKHQPEIAAVIAAELGYELRESSGAHMAAADPTKRS